MLLDTAPGAMAATAMNNGSARDHRPSAPPTAADIGTPAANASDAREARPPAVTLLARILELIEQSHRPKHPWQIQKELNLPRMPSAELNKLTAQGFLVRLREGLYGVAGRDYQNWLQGQTMPTIHARHPAGFLITFEDVDRDR